MSVRENKPSPPIKVALILNLIAPSRIPVYSGLAENFELLVLHGGMESNRDSWRDTEQMLKNAKVTQAWGWQMFIPRKQDSKFFEPRYLHITPGYIWHLLRFHPDVVIANEMGFRTVIALCYGTLFRKPVWVWWGGTLHTERNLGTVRRTLRRIISRWARNWISYGRSSTEYLLTLEIKRKQILQTQNAADEQHFAANWQPKFHLQPRPVVLHVGQFIPRKGIEPFLRAASILQNEGLEFSLLFVGGGRDRIAMEQHARDLQLKNVHFHPSQPPESMPSVYRSADVLVFPTLEDVWGLVANEAILSRLPVLCSKYAGCAEELFDPENIFDPQNPEEFIKKLRQTITGKLQVSDLSRLKTTAQIVSEMVHAVNISVNGGTKRPTSVMIGQLDQ